MQQNKVLSDYFLDLKRCIANDEKINMIENGINSSYGCDSTIERNIVELNVNRTKKIIFCMLLRLNNHSFIFFKVQSIKNLSHLNTIF